MTTPMLEISDLHAWYGEAHVLHGVNFQVHQGEVVTLLGRNGAGRTTTLRAVFGLLNRREGSIRIGGQEVIDWPAYQIAHLGLGYCPEERGIFPGLTCEENLLLPANCGCKAARRCPWMKSTNCSPISTNGDIPPARVCLVVNSRCWQWPGSFAQGLVCCSWTKYPRAWRRSSCRPWRI